MIHSYSPFVFGPRFPRCRLELLLLTRLASDLGKGEALVGNLRQRKLESAKIGDAIFFLLSDAVVVTKNLFVNIQLKIKRLYRYVSRSQVAFEKRPEILQTVRADTAFNVLLGMVHNVMDVTRVQEVVSGRTVCIDFGSVLHVAENLSL